MSKAKSIAQKMLKSNLKIDEISEYTGLSREEIEKLEIIA